MSNWRLRLVAAVPCLVLLAACNRDPRAVAKKYVDSGNKYFDRGKYKEASIMYRRALSKDMRYADGWYRLGLTNLKLRLPGEARRNFSRAMEIDPGNTDAIVRLGDIDLIFYMVDPQGNRALLNDLKDLSQQLFKKDAKSFDGLRFAGYVALLQKDHKTAIQKFEAADQVKPDQPDLVLSLVQALFQDGQKEEAEKYAKQLIEKQKSYGPMYDALYLYYVRSNRPELGEELLKKKIANNPTEGSALLQLAFHYYMANRKQEMAATIERLTSNPKVFPDNHMQAGDFYERIRDFDGALQQYDQGQKEDSKNRRVYQKKMVEVLGTQGKREPASKLLTALLKDDPKDPEALAMHATLLLETGDKAQVKTVIAELQPLITKMPGNPTLHLNLGRAYMTAGDPQSLDQARIQFLEALKIEQHYLPARLALGQLQIQRGENPQAVQTAEEVIAADPTNLSARLIRATGLMNMREFQRAREELNAILKLYPKSNDAHFQIGELDYMERRFADADAEFKILMAANDPRGLPGIIEAKAAQGQWNDAIKLAEDEVRQSPDRIDYRTELAIVCSRAGRFAEAIEQFQKLIEKRPNSPELYVHLGEVKKSAGDIRGAIESFQKASQMDPRNVASHLDLAMTYEQTGHDEDARKSYEDVIKIQPDNVEALNNLAYLKADGNVDLDQALTYARQAQQKRPNDPNVADTVALIYIKKSLTDDSIRLLRELVSQKPDNPTFHLHLAMALYQKGDRPLAKKELEAALRNKPTEKDQAAIRQLLAKVG
ncbi:MAG TPA: tetratricopeptide repeat protein [Bryobacteraceae bacterium]|nr:tetratricopeptide repeat protein [Bryobacteraceae bacterium]